MAMVEKVKAKMPELAALAQSDNPVAVFLREVSANPMDVRGRLSELLARLQAYFEAHKPVSMKSFKNFKAKLEQGAASVKERASSINVPSMASYMGEPTSPSRLPGGVAGGSDHGDSSPEGIPPVAPAPVTIPDAAEPATLGDLSEAGPAGGEGESAAAAAPLEEAAPAAVETEPAVEPAEEAAPAPVEEAPAEVPADTSAESPAGAVPLVETSQVEVEQAQATPRNDGAP